MSCKTRAMNTLRTRAGRNAFGRGSPTAVSCQSVQDLVQIPRDSLWQTHKSKSGQAPKEMTERQNWIQDKFIFLKTHIRCKGLSKSSAFKSAAQGASASAASAHDISRGSTDMDSMKISRSNTTIQPSVTSPSAVSQHSSVD